jgi:hypothetical protein
MRNRQKILLRINLNGYGNHCLTLELSGAGNGCRSTSVISVSLKSGFLQIAQAVESPKTPLPTIKMEGISTARSEEAIARKIRRDYDSLIQKEDLNGNENKRCLSAPKSIFQSNRAPMSSNGVVVDRAWGSTEAAAETARSLDHPEQQRPGNLFSTATEGTDQLSVKSTPFLARNCSTAI